MQEVGTLRWIWPSTGGLGTLRNGCRRRASELRICRVGARRPREPDVGEEHERAAMGGTSRNLAARHGVALVNAFVEARPRPQSGTFFQRFLAEGHHVGKDRASPPAQVTTASGARRDSIRKRRRGLFDRRSRVVKFQRHIFMAIDLCG